MAKSNPFSFRLDNDLKNALRADAEAQNRSLASLVNLILREWHQKKVAPNTKESK